MPLITRQGKGSKLTIQEMDGNLEYLRGSYKLTESTNIDWSEASMQEFELNDNTTFSFTGAEAGQKLTLLLNQKNSANITWPNTVKWVNNITPEFKVEFKIDETFDTGTEFSFEVDTIALQPDGKILVSKYIEGEDFDYIVRVNSDGTVDNTFSTGTGFSGGSIQTIVLLSSGKILAGGGFEEFNGEVANKIVRLNPDGSLDETFNTGDGFNDRVNLIALQSDGKILVGGGFDEFDGESVGYIARLNPDGSLDETFNAETGINEVETIVIGTGGKIFSGGFAGVFGGGHVSIRNSNGALEQILYADSSINTIVLQPDEKILASGYFSEFDGEDVLCVVRLDGQGNYRIVDFYYNGEFFIGNSPITQTQVNV